MKTKEVLNEVLEERESQNTKWGQQDHSPAHWLMILGEEVGEANKAALEHFFSYNNNTPLGHLKSLREELIQVAAVAIAIIESLDRNEIMDSNLSL